MLAVYKDNLDSYPRNPRFDDDWWNRYRIGYVPGRRDFITINASEGMDDFPDRYMVFSVNTGRMAITLKQSPTNEQHMVPEAHQPFLRGLTARVHDRYDRIQRERTEAERRRKEKAEQELQYYLTNKERIDEERRLAKLEQEERTRKAEEERIKAEQERKERAKKAEEEKCERITARIIAVKQKLKNTERSKVAVKSEPSKEDISDESYASEQRTVNEKPEETVAPEVTPELSRDDVPNVRLPSEKVGARENDAEGITKRFRQEDESVSEK